MTKRHWPAITVTVVYFGALVYGIGKLGEWMEKKEKERV